MSDVDPVWVAYAARAAAQGVAVDPLRIELLYEARAAGIPLERVALELGVAMSREERFALRVVDELGYTGRDAAVLLGVSAATVSRMRRRVMRRLVAPAPRACEGCGKPLPEGSRSHRRFHDSRCRRVSCNSGVG